MKRGLNSIFDLDMYTYEPIGPRICCFQGGAGGAAGGAAGEGGTGGDAGGDAGSAQDDSGTGADGDAGEGDEGSDDGSGKGDAAKDDAKTLSQKELSRLLSREKEQGRRAILNELGITDPAQAKTLLELAKKLSDAGKTPEDKLTEEERKTREAEERAETAERKLVLVKEKANDDMIDDILLLAKARMSDKTDFAAAVKLVKEQFPSMFEGEEGSAGGTGGKGTGRTPGARKQKNDEIGSYGKRAAQAGKTGKAPGKSSFFSNT